MAEERLINRFFKDYCIKKNMKQREVVLNSGAIIFLGKNSKNNDELVTSYLGKENTIIHTAKPGSPFCVIDKLNPTKEEIKTSAIICASKSQDWRENRGDVVVHVFTGKDVEKNKGMKEGTWKIKSKPKLIKIKKKEIEEWIKSVEKRGEEKSCQQ